jgi:hypothetical protein
MAEYLQLNTEQLVEWFQIDHDDKGYGIQTDEEIVQDVMKETARYLDDENSDEEISVAEETQSISSREAYKGLEMDGDSFSLSWSETFSCYW